MRVMQRGNDIGDRGAELLAEGLKVNSSVQELRLVRLPLLLFAATYPTSPTPQNGLTALTRLRQGSNCVGDCGAAWLGDALKVNSSLQKLFVVRKQRFAYATSCSGAYSRSAGQEPDIRHWRCLYGRGS